jgi:hypothetical protein
LGCNDGHFGVIELAIALMAPWHRRMTIGYSHLMAGHVGKQSLVLPIQQNIIDPFRRLVPSQAVGQYRSAANDDINGHCAGLSQAPASMPRARAGRHGMLPLAARDDMSAARLVVWNAQLCDDGGPVVVGEIIRGGLVCYGLVRRRPAGALARRCFASMSSASRCMLGATNSAKGMMFSRELASSSEAM